MTADPLIAHIDHHVKSGVFSPELAHIAKAFCRDYQKAVTDQVAQAKTREVLMHLIDLAAQQIQNPYAFDCIHHRIRTPFDYTQFGLDLVGPLVDRDRSTVIGEANIAQMEAQLARGESCVLLSNHQIEADPQVIHLFLAQKYPRVADLYAVAGDRVTTDPLAVPLSLGTNLICIFSKRHMEHPPELKEAKLRHNRRAMQALGGLLAQGGCCVWVAPSGGRDRANAQGQIEVAPFDPQSIEMFRLLAKGASRPVHFYPLALATFHLLPPPQSVQQAIGEPRKICRTGVHLAFGEELDLSLLGASATDRKEQQRLRAAAIWQVVNGLYSKARSRASAMLDT